MNRSETQARLESAALRIRGLAHRYARRPALLFDSWTRGEAGWDADLAVLSRAMPAVFKQGRWQAELVAWSYELPWLERLA